MRFRSLTTRFVVTVLLATAVPFLAFGRYVREDVRKSLESEVVFLLVERESALAASKLQNDVERTLRSIQLMLPDLKRTLGPNGEAELEQALVGRGNEEVIESVLVVDSTGETRAFWSTEMLNRMTRERVLSRVPFDVVDRAWYRELRDEGRSFFLLDRHLSPFREEDPTARPQDPQRYSFGVALPFFAGGELGYAVFRFPWAAIQSSIETIAATLRKKRDGPDLSLLQVELVGDDGQIRATSSDRSRLVERVASVELREALASGAGGSVYVERDGEQHLVGIGVVGKTVAGTYPWRFAIAWPTQALFEPVVELDRSIYLVTAIVVVLLVIASGLVSHAALSPVGALVTATERLARGDLGTRVNVTGRDELADLGVAFNSMAEQLEKTQAQLRQAERDAAWAEMARQVAHEIKNPLTPMRMSAQRLARAHATGDERMPELVERTTRTVIEQTEQLQRIADDFRHFAGGPSRALVPVEIEIVHERVRNDFSAASEAEGEARVVVHEPRDQVEIRADLGELGRVFLNLVGNARAAAGADGTVEVSSHLVGESVEFSVRDDGPGIDPGIIEHLFEPYFTTKSSGTGLGLAICRRAIEAHGGHIELVSFEKGCTEFRFTIPVAGADAVDD